LIEPGRTTRPGLPFELVGIAGRDESMRRLTEKTKSRQLLAEKYAENLAGKYRQTYPELHARLHLLPNLNLDLCVYLDLDFNLYLDLNLSLFQLSFEKPFAALSAALTLGFSLLASDFVRPPMLPSRQ